LGEQVGDRLFLLCLIATVEKQLDRFVSEAFHAQGEPRDGEVGSLESRLGDGQEGSAL
jgi:hypothetical protein